MPTYTYRCDNCGIQFEKVQKFVDQAMIRCPECGKKSLKKVYTPVGIVFKGSGFYATDHRSPSGIKYGLKTSEEKSPDAKPSTESSSESKPAVESKPTAVAPPSNSTDS
jgi:putative FmdB family regulatory protein